MKILFFGDIVGKGARKALQTLVPELKKEFAPDIVIANAENIAHGTGITRATLTEVRDAGIDAFTSGNHVWRKDEALELVSDPSFILLRPHNMPEGPGSGVRLIPVGPYQLLLVNMEGQVFMNEGLNNPFQAMEAILQSHETKQAHAILVDFHAEVTSEKNAFGHFLDGKVSAVVGTHTHIATADARILPAGTAYVTDIGMCGAQESVLGVDKNIIVTKFRTGRAKAFEVIETGTMIMNAVLIDIDPQTKLARSIVRVDRTVQIA